MADAQKFMTMLFEGVPQTSRDEFLQLAAQWTFADKQEDQIRASIALMDFAETNPEAFTVLTSDSLWQDMGKAIMESIIIARSDPDIAAALKAYRELK